MEADHPPAHFQHVNGARGDLVGTEGEVIAAGGDEGGVVAPVRLGTQRQVAQQRFDLASRAFGDYLLLARAQAFAKRRMASAPSR